MTAYIGAENLIEDATSVTATNEATGFEVENLYDRRTSTWWKPGVAGSQYAQINFTGAQTVDYLGIIGHNLGTEGCTLTLMYYDTSASPNAYTNHIQIIPENDECIFIKVDAVSIGTWRLYIDNCTVDALIGYAAFGQAVELPEGLKAPYMPPPYARNKEISNMVTEGGQFIGRSVWSSGYEFEIPQTLVDPSWVKTNYDDLIDRLEVAPFFYVWDYEIDNSPSVDNSIFAWAEEFTHAKYTHNGKLYMDFSMKGKGLLE